MYLIQVELPRLLNPDMILNPDLGTANQVSLYLFVVAVGLDT